MIQPEALKKREPLLWSPGSGVDVWDMFCACLAGDLPTVKRLVAKDPSLVRSHYAYRTPLYFAVRENRMDVVAFLLEHGADPLGLAVNDSLLEISRDRGYEEMETLLETNLADTQNASPRGEAVAAAIRQHDLPKVRRLLDASPELLHVGDERSNQPIHWAAMTRQIELIDELLARGADIDAARFDGARPIQLTNGDYRFRGWRDVPRTRPPPPPRCSRTSAPAVRSATSARRATWATWRGCASSSIRTRPWPIAFRTTSPTTSAPARRSGTPPPPDTSRSSSSSWSAAPIRTCARRASHRTATRSIPPSRTGTSRSPGSCWNTARSRTRRSRAPPMP